MAGIDKYSIRFDQRNQANTAYSETYVSGSELILQTDISGSITGSNTINRLSASNASFGTTFFNGVTNFLNTVYTAFGIIGDVTGSVSGSVGIFSQLTASAISGSIQNAVLLNNTASYVFATTSSNSFTGSQNISGSLSASAAIFTSFFLNTASIAPTSSNEYGTLGEVRIDNNYLYIYTNLKWHRFPAALWN